MLHQLCEMTTAMNIHEPRKPNMGSSLLLGFGDFDWFFSASDLDSKIIGLDCLETQKQMIADAHTATDIPIWVRKMLLFGWLTQAASESNFRKLSAAGAMATPTRAQKCQSLRILLSIFAWMFISEFTWVHTTHARFENWQGRGIIFARQGFH